MAQFSSLELETCQVSFISKNFFFILVKLSVFFYIIFISSRIHIVLDQRLKIFWMLNFKNLDKLLVTPRKTMKLGELMGWNEKSESGSTWVIFSLFFNLGMITWSHFRPQRWSCHTKILDRLFRLLNLFFGFFLFLSKNSEYKPIFTMFPNNNKLWSNR